MVLENTPLEVRVLEADDALERMLIVSDLRAYAEPIEAFDKVRAGYEEMTQVVAAGDIFLGGVDPAECVDWVCANAGEFSVLGNHDQGALAGSGGGNPPYTEPGACRRLNASQLRYLRGLPPALEVRWRGKRLRILHGPLRFRANG
jgi:predicted phosphodiesterase